MMRIMCRIVHPTSTTQSYVDDIIVKTDHYRITLIIPPIKRLFS